ncbi:MAG TPA: sialidase family protein [Mycobacteriales bacterium]|nr:sialidase family protein [Mycobacteriales bacterium]
MNRNARSLLSLDMSRRRPVIAACALVLLGAAAPAVSAPRGRPGYAVDVLRKVGGEPSVAVSPDGRTVLVTGPASARRGLHRSTDGGRTYHLTPAFQRFGGQDVDLAFVDSTRVVMADLALDGSGILVHRSADRGATWTTATINQDLYDRPWIAAFGETVYVAARGFDQVSYLYTSTDGGQTFGPPAVIVGTEASGPGPADAVGVVIQDLVVDEVTGDLYVLKLHTTGIYVSRLVPGAVPRFDSRLITREWTDIGFNSMTVDPAGTVYMLSHEESDGVLASVLYHSTDRGRTWSAGVDVADSRDGGSVFGAIDAGPTGVLSLVHLRGQGKPNTVAQDWHAEVGVIRRADTDRPAVTLVRPLRAPIHQKDICGLGIACAGGQNRNLLEFISTSMTAKGVVHAVVGSDGPATGDSPSVGKTGVTAVVFRSR